MGITEKIKKATDKLFSQEITLRKRISSYDSFGETEGNTFEDFVLNGLFILKKQEFKHSVGGEADLADGYCQFNRLDLERVEAMVANKLVLEADSIVLFQSISYEVVGIVPLAPDFQDTDKFVLYQLFVRKSPNN